MMRFWRPDNAHKRETWVRRNGRPGWKWMTWQELESYYSDDEKLIDRLGNRARAIQQRRYEQENPSILPWLIVAWGAPTSCEISVAPPRRCADYVDSSAPACLLFDCSRAYLLCVCAYCYVASVF